MSKDLIERLKTEADQCRNDGADDIARLLDEAVTALRAPDAPAGWRVERLGERDGEIAPAMCIKVADDLERLLPRMEALGWESHGHIAARGGFIEVVRKFIAGCRAAAAAGEPLDFH